jgi:predicted transcriptional regulator
MATPASKPQPTASKPHPTRPVQRLSVNLSPEVAEALQWIAEKHGSTITEAVRRCISTQKWVEEALDRKAKILIAEEGQPVRELVFV